MGRKGERVAVNLKAETLEFLANHGKTPDDIRWIGNGVEIPIDEFWRVADRVYDNGYGCAEVCYIYIVGDDWWMERGEYDGAEWWEFKTMPKKPTIVADNPLTSVFDAYALY